MPPIKVNLMDCDERAAVRSEATNRRLLVMWVDDMLLSLCSSRPSLLVKSHLDPLLLRVEHLGIEGNPVEGRLSSAPPVACGCAGVHLSNRKSSCRGEDVSRCI